MRILVCIKQVPASSNVKVDPETGNLLRTSSDTKLNPYDEYALETALQIKTITNSINKSTTVSVITMGAPFSEEILREAYGFGADEAYLLTDPAFAGADVLATSFALSQAIQVIGPFDLIICGRQTTDGDTAQVGPALAEWLKIPHISWVSKIISLNPTEIIVEQDMGDLKADAAMPYPCLITVEKDIFRPRLPSYLLLKNTKNRMIKSLSVSDLPCKDIKRYGLLGSPTQVEKIFPPESGESSEVFIGSGEEVADLIFEKLNSLKLIN